jgi:TonB family protein
MLRSNRFSGVLVLVAVAGCRHELREVSTRPAPSDRGKAEYRFLADPHVSIAHGLHFVDPSPVAELPLPQYPPSALAAGAGSSHVTVRIVIDTDGRVADVTDSPLERSSGGPHAREFKDAVLRSLRHWRFTPGRLDAVEDGPDEDRDGEPDYRKVTRMDPVRVFYDVRFDFDTVAGTGIVRTSADGGAKP